MKATFHPRAKLNLGLRILRRRDDGYHDILSVFQEISLSDRLELEISSGDGEISMECSGEVPCGPENLAWKAASMFVGMSGLHIDVHIRLSKGIPVRAGLGGGSSDAASVLTGLSGMTGQNDLDLFPAAEALGSDVPFFLTGGSAIVRGRGENVHPVPAIPFHAVLIHPAIQVSTPAAYSMWDEEGIAGDRTGSYLTNSDMNRHNSASSAVWHEGKPYPRDLRNDFLPLLEKRIPEIEEVARYLSESRCGSWGLSGSGPTFFALFRREEEALGFSQSLRWNSSICRTADTAGASSNG